MKSDQLQEEERKRIESNFYILGLCLPGIGAGLYLLIRLLPAGVLSVFSVPCLFHAVTGLYCPGCGGTRAVQVLFEGKFLLSFFLPSHCAILRGIVPLVYDFPYGRAVVREAAARRHAVSESVFISGPGDRSHKHSRQRHCSDGLSSGFFEITGQCPASDIILLSYLPDTSACIPAEYRRCPHIG